MILYVIIIAIVVSLFSMSGVAAYFLLNKTSSGTSSNMSSNMPSNTSSGKSFMSSDANTIELNWSCKDSIIPLGIIQTNKLVGTSLEDLQTEALSECKTKYSKTTSADMLSTDLKKDYKCNTDGIKWFLIKDDLSKRKYKCLTNGDNKCVEYNTEKECKDETKDLYTSFTKECAETNWGTLCSNLYGVPGFTWDTKVTGTWGECVSTKDDECPSNNTAYVLKKGIQSATKCIKDYGSPACTDPPTKTCDLKVQISNTDLNDTSNTAHAKYCPIDSRLNTQQEYGSICTPVTTDDGCLDPSRVYKKGTMTITQKCTPAKYGGKNECENKIIRTDNCDSNSPCNIEYTKHTNKDYKIKPLTTYKGTLSDCKTQCIQNKDCKQFSFKDNTCWLKGEKKDVKMHDSTGVDLYKKIIKSPTPQLTKIFDCSYNQSFDENARDWKSNSCIKTFQNIQTNEYIREALTVR